MLYNLIKIQHGKETLMMTDSLVKVRKRKKQLLDCQRNNNLRYIINLAEDNIKYKKPPCMNFDPSGDAGTEKYIKRKNKAKALKKQAIKSIKHKNEQTHSEEE